MKKLYFILLLLVSVSHSATAGGTWHSGTIKWVYPLANGDFVITFTNDSPSCPSTSKTKYHYARVGKNSVTKEGIKFLYSAALAAASSGKKININFDSSSSHCYINRLFVNF